MIVLQGNMELIFFARVIVKMDVTEALPDHMWIEDINGREFKQHVLYDWKPSYCNKCQMLGHDFSTLVHKKDRVQKKGPPVVKKVWVPKSSLWFLRFSQHMLHLWLHLYIKPCL